VDLVGAENLPVVVEAPIIAARHRDENVTPKARPNEVAAPPKPKRGKAVRQKLGDSAHNSAANSALPKPQFPRGPSPHSSSSVKHNE